MLWKRKFSGLTLEIEPGYAAIKGEKGIAVRVDPYWVCQKIVDPYGVCQ